MGKTENAIAVINISKDKIFKICKKTLVKYCNKYDIALEVITEPRFNILGTDTAYNYLIFEKNQIYDLFKDYNRILRLDADILITPHCPNIFEVVPLDKIGIVFEDVGPKKIDRRKTIKQIQLELGGVGWEKGYFNSGVIVTSKLHKEIFNITDKKNIKIIEKLRLSHAKEQSLLNYRVRELGFELFELDFKFNHITKIFSGQCVGNPNKFNSYILHYAGNQKHKLKSMKFDYKNLCKIKRK